MVCDAQVAPHVMGASQQAERESVASTAAQFLCHEPYIAAGSLPYPATSMPGAGGLLIWLGVAHVQNP
eukprot:jgi/Tetstr1/439107/TSEL_002972.t1